MISIKQSNALSNPCADVFLLAQQVYKPEDVIPQAILERWWQKHPSLFSLAYEGDVLCGYLSALPLTQEAFQETLEFSFDEKTLEPSSIVAFDLVGVYQVYFSSIVVHSDWHGTGVSKGLRRVFLEYLLSLWSKGKCVNALSSVVVSAKGASMMRSLGMRFSFSCAQGDLFYADHTEASLRQCLKELE